MSNVIDLDWLPFDAFDELYKYDQTKVGTTHDLGLAFFWSGNYASSGLRDATPKQRKKVHDQWLKLKLDLQGQSKKHEEVIKTVLASGGRNQKMLT